MFEAVLGREGWGHRPAILGKNGASYGQLLAEVNRLSAFLLAEGIGKGSIVVICFPPTKDYIIALLALYQVSAVVVPLNPGAPANEKRFFIQNATADCLMIDLDISKTNEFADVSREASSGSIQILQLKVKEQVEPEPDDYIIIHTSGSTEQPKGVVLSERAVSSNVRAVANDLSVAPGDRAILYTPTAFAYAVNQILVQLWSGGSLLLWEHGLMFPKKILDAIDELEIACLPANLPSLRMWLSIKGAEALSYPTVRYIISAGQHLYLPVARATLEMFPNSRIVNPYGCTENSPRISHYWVPTHLPERDDQWPVGRPLDGVEVKIADHDGNELAIGEIGEVLVRGSSLMRGYWRMPELTAERMRDGWFRTADQAFRDHNGHINLRGRIDNVINVGHEKVSPEEIEAVIEQIEGVDAVGVGYMPDPILENVCVALIAIEGDREIVIGRVERACRDQLSVAKVPRRFIVVNTVPKTLYGKLDRRRIMKTIDGILGK